MSNLFVYLSGKAGAVVLLLAFQILAVSLLGAVAYSLYAVMLALVSVTSAFGALGAPRVLPKYVAQARSAKFAASAFRLVRGLLVLQLIVAIIAGVACFLIASSVLAHEVRLDLTLMVPVIALGIVTIFYANGETISQALGQQIVSRRVALIEPVVRIAAMLGLAHMELLDAKALILLLVVTQGVAASILLALSLSRLRRDGRQSGPAADFPAGEVRSLASAGYFSGLAFLASAPAVVRIVAAAFLPASTMAAFSFCQLIATNLLKYSPGFVLFPFVEPVLHGSTAGEAERREELQSALSLLGKIDLFSLGFAAVSVMFAAFLLESASGLRLEEAKIIAPAVLLLIPLGTLYRSLEVVASFSARVGPLYIGLVTGPVMLILLYALGPMLGLWALLFIPLLEGLFRIAAVDQLLRRAGTPRAIDWRFVISLFVYLLLWIELWFLEPSSQTGWAYAAGIAGFLLLAFLVRPLTTNELDLLRRRTKFDRLADIAAHFSRPAK